MKQTVVLSDEQMATIAAAIAPDIRVYIDAHRGEYEEYLKRWEEQRGEAVN